MRPTEMNIFHDLKCNTRISFVLQAVTDGLILHLITESCKPQQGSRDHANKVSKLYLANSLGYGV